MHKKRDRSTLGDATAAAAVIPAKRLKKLRESDSHPVEVFHNTVESIVSEPSSSPAPPLRQHAGCRFLIRSWIALGLATVQSAAKILVGAAARMEASAVH